MKKSVQNSVLVGLMCVSVLLLCRFTPAMAVKKIRTGTVALPETTLHQALVKWQSILQEKSKGELAVTILDRGVMGGDREMIEACRLGTLDSAVVSGSVLSNLVPQFFMIPLPYLFNDHAEVNAYLDGPFGAKLFGMLEPKDLVGLGWATWSFRGVWNNVRPIVKPDDIKGLKIRTVETPLDMSTMNSMGGVATPMSWNECLLGLRQGTVDGISTTYGLGYALKLYDISKFATQTKHYYETAPLIMSKKLFEKFTPAGAEADQGIGGGGPALGQDGAGQGRRGERPAARKEGRQSQYDPRRRPSRCSGRGPGRSTPSSWTRSARSSWTSPWPSSRRTGRNKLPTPTRGGFESRPGNGGLSCSRKRF